VGPDVVCTPSAIHAHTSTTTRYIFGDNAPYYADANRVLKAMGLPQMSGCYSAQQYLAPFDPATGRGYATHAVTTGISSRLYVVHRVATHCMIHIILT
jgi:hypothetical protein